MNKALVNFSFDDGRIDNYTIAYPILKEYGLPATFNITTGYVEGKFEKGRLTPAEPMTVEMVKELYADKTMEIAGHGYWHKNDLEDILKGIDTLREHLNIERMGGAFSFASPGTDLSEYEYESIKDDLKKSGICCVRLSMRFLTLRRFRVLMRKAARVLHFPLFYRWAYQDTLMADLKDDIIYSIPVLSSTTVAEVKSLVKHAIKKKSACVLMMHSIVEDGTARDNWDYDVSKFQELSKWLYEKQQDGCLKVVTTQTIYNTLNEI